MAIENIVVCMNGSDKETSYAANSLLQRNVLMKTRPILEDTIKDMFKKAVPSCINMADLGCASGPNTFFLLSEVMGVIKSMCYQQGIQESLEFQVFLNDLPGNDFNSILKHIPTFCNNLSDEIGHKLGPCFILALPGSFYGRLFPTNYMHFIHSSYSIHWLSKVPKGVENHNKGNIYIAKSSPKEVITAYMEQFREDFSNFLSLRSQEMVVGGRILLTVVGRSIIDPTSNDCCCLWELLAKSLLHLVSLGLVEECDVDSFNMPYYNPCKEEVQEIIMKEGSFDLNKLEVFEFNWDPEDNSDSKKFVFDKYKSGQNVSNLIRAIVETMLGNHFGESIVDKLFTTYAQLVAEHLSEERTKFVNITIAMTRK